MPFKLPSFSKWPRVMKCAASAVLPQFTPDDTTFSRVGTLVHKFIERAAEIGRDDALAEIPAEEEDAIRFCEALELDALPVSAQSFAHELPLLYFPESDTARPWDRETENGLKRPDGASAGILDVVGVSEDTVYYGDFKTGWTSLGEAADNWQLRIGALAAARRYGKDNAIVEIITLRDDGGVYTDRAALDAIDLDDAATEIYERVKLMESLMENGVESESVREGPWCRYCPAFRACPAKVSMVNLIMQAPSATIDSIRANLTIQNAASAYARFKLMKQALNEIQSAIYGFAAEHPIPTEDGQVLKLVTSTRESLDGDIVFSLMKELHGVTAADQAVKRTASKSSVEEVFRTMPREKGVTIKSLKEAFLAALAERGGIDTSTSSTVKEVKA